MTPNDTERLIEALTNIAKAMPYGPDQAWIEEAIERLSTRPMTDKARDLIERLRERAQPQTWRHIADKRIMAEAADFIEQHLTPASEENDVIQGNASGEKAALDDLDKIEPVYQGLRTYAKNRRLLVLSIADLRRAARLAIASLTPASEEVTEASTPAKCEQLSEREINLIYDSLPTKPPAAACLDPLILKEPESYYSRTAVRLIGNAALAMRSAALPLSGEGVFQIGDFVQKKSGASWRGKVVGRYRTDLTAIGYAIESIFEPGSVQIYPESALTPYRPLSGDTNEDLGA